MLLLGKNAAALRRQAAELFVRYHGGDLRVAKEVIAARERQDEMRVEDPARPLRCCGAEVEREAGTTSEKKLRREEALREGGRRQTAYDPATQSAASRAQGRSRLFVDGLCRVFGQSFPGYVAVLDDLNGETPPVPRTAKALRDGDVPLSRILAPNKEVTVVRALQDFGVNSVNKHLSWASQEEYSTHNVSGAYLDELPWLPRLSAGTPPSAASTLPARHMPAADVNGGLDVAAVLREWGDTTSPHSQSPFFHRRARRQLISGAGSSGRLRAPLPHSWQRLRRSEFPGASRCGTAACR